ncbi:MAG: hypothetical protein Q9203_001912 [Teloschistes exilis]
MTPAPALHSVSASQPGPIDGGDGKEWLAAPLENSNGTIDQPLSMTATNSTRHRNARWWKIRLFRGMKKDIRRRAPFYWSDWKDAWDYRVVPATVYMYFANILPALAFSLDMFDKTDGSFGVNEVLLASVLGAVVFSICACQPLVIVGVTGKDYLIVAASWLLSLTNRQVLSRFSTTRCDIFGFYVAFIYLQKGIQVLTRQWAPGGEAAYLSITVALLVLMTAYLCGALGGTSLFQRNVRIFIEDYGTPLTIIFFTGFVHIGRMADVNLQTLPTTKAFFPTKDRGWFIHFWDIDVSDVFIAIPFAPHKLSFDYIRMLRAQRLTVSSLIAQGTEFPLRKPAGFHWDIFLLGLTTGVAGLLGIPFPNGLIPQAPFHTNALCVTKQVADEPETGRDKGHNTRVVDHVVEQRVSNLMQGLLTLGTMSGPLLIVIHLIPDGVLAGLFFVMGVQALEGNGITLKMLHLARERSLTAASDPLSRMQRKTAIWCFVALELFGFGATFAITQTIAAIGFPIIILLLIPLRTFFLPKYFMQDELSILDAPTASPFTMESVGGNYGEEMDATSNGAGGIHRFQSTEQREEDSIERGEAGKLHESWTGRGSDMKENANGVVPQQHIGKGDGLRHRSRSRSTRS